MRKLVILIVGAPILLVLILAVVFWFSWMGLQSNDAGAAWTYSEMVAQADAGHVKAADIKGDTAVLTSVDGLHHPVQLPAGDRSQLTQRLVRDHVDVLIEAQPTVSASVVLVGIVGFLLGVVVGGIGVSLLTRRRRSM